MKQAPLVDVRLTSEGADGWEFLVRVADGTGQTEHRVHLACTDYERLAGGAVTPEALLQRTFDFLLGREPKEAILWQFDLSVVARYFPDFETEVRRLLG